MSLNRYTDRPIDFIKEILQIQYLTPQQEEILLSIKNNRVTNVQAAHGVGKSFISALAVLWWVFAREGTAITTAPTRNQVEKILWREIAQIYDRHVEMLGGERGKSFIRLSAEAQAWGFTAVSYKPDVFQGIHAERLLVIQDEANGVSEEIDDGAIACTTGAENRMLRIGNPVHGGTPFEKACVDTHIRVPAWSHPNVSWAYEQDANGMHRLKPDIAQQISRVNDRGKREFLPESCWPQSILDLRPVSIPGAISIDWIEGVRDKKGDDSAFWEGRVEGRFPSLSANCAIIPSSWIVAARARYDADPRYWDALAAQYIWRHGLDVGDGGDSHAIASWRGPVLYRVDLISTKGDRQDVSRAAHLGYSRLLELGGVVAVDRIGVGAGALSELLGRLSQSMLKGSSAVGCNFGGAASNPGHYENARAEQYWKLREAFQNGEVAIAQIEKEDDIIAGFSQILYEETPQGKLKIESKKFIRQRLHRSPDAEDAIVMGFNTTAITPTSQPIILGKRRSVMSAMAGY